MQHNGKIESIDVDRYKSIYFHIKAARVQMGKTISDDKVHSAMKIFDQLQKMEETLQAWSASGKIE